jgi:septal ring factor EnvC (AmiA/AmiB activator)
MKNLKLSAAMSVLLGVMWSGPAAYGQSTPPPTNSAPDSQTSATRAISACAAAVAELEASRRLIDLLERENRLVKDRLGTETRTTAMLTELNASRKAESESLRTALAAKAETLAAKDEVIASQQKLIDSLKAKKSSPWKRLGDILIGVAAGMVLR